MKVITTILSATLLAPLALAAGGFTCQSAPSGNRLAYCVYDPVDNAPDGGWPTIISMPGSGARGPASNAKSLAGYDAVGKLIAHYLSGENKDEVHTMAATKFLTIVPISPDGTRHFFPDDVLQVLNEVKKNYKVNSDKVYVTGYSMGSRGSWRFAVHHPEVIAALAPSAGGAEQAGDSTLTQEAADPVFPLLDKIVDIPIRQFAGSKDTTAGTESPKKTQNKLKELGAKDATLTIMDTDHSGLSTKPWTDTDLLSWFLKQSRSGSSGSSAPSKSESSPNDASYTPVPAATQSAVTPEEEDCEDEEDPSTDDDDCEEEENTSTDGTEGSADNEEDCEEEDNSSIDEDEDCGPEDDEETESSTGDSGSYGGSDSGSEKTTQDSGSSYSNKDYSSSPDQPSQNKSSGFERKYKQAYKSLASEDSASNGPNKSLAMEIPSDDTANNSSSTEAKEAVQPSRRARRGHLARDLPAIQARQQHQHMSHRMFHRRRAVRFGKASSHRH